MTRTKKIIYVKRFTGEPKHSDFKLVSEELPALEENDVLVEAKFLSVDPYMRVYMERYALGSTMIGSQVARVLQSRCPDFKVDDFVFGNFGWQTHTVFNPAKRDEPVKPFVLPPFGNLSPSNGCGILGYSGLTAYFGLLELCNPKSGEVVAVTGAGGAVGSIVGQIAKLFGCTVIGFAGTDDKCKWLVDELGFDQVINYRTTTNIATELKRVAPNGIDCYFDNVGGELSSTIIHQMNHRGRVSCCGSISSYNDEPANWPRVPLLQPSLVFKELKMEGFLVNRWANRWSEGVEKLWEWVQAGKIKTHETRTVGFENMPQAFIDMLRGKNVGKAVVVV